MSSPRRLETARSPSSAHTGPTNGHPMTFRYTTTHGDSITAEPDCFEDGTPALYIETSGPVRIHPDRLEEVIAGLRDIARQAATGAAA